MKPECPVIYLAGPAVFHPDAAGIGRRLQALCTAAGCKGLFPLDAEVPGDAGCGPAQAAAILQANLALLERADAVLADCTPFRSPSLDPGTAFEIGYAVARGKPVAGWSETAGAYRLRVAQAVRCASGWRDAGGWVIEDFGLPDNLMISASLVAMADDPAGALTQLLAHLRAR